MFVRVCTAGLLLFPGFFSRVGARCIGSSISLILALSLSLSIYRTTLGSTAPEHWPSVSEAVPRRGRPPPLHPACTRHRFDGRPSPPSIYYGAHFCPGCRPYTRGRALTLVAHLPVSLSLSHSLARCFNPPSICPTKPTWQQLVRSRSRVSSKIERVRGGGCSGSTHNRKWKMRNGREQAHREGLIGQNSGTARRVRTIN